MLSATWILSVEFPSRQVASLLSKWLFGLSNRLSVLSKGLALAGNESLPRPTQRFSKGKLKLYAFKRDMAAFMGVSSLRSL